MTFYINDVSIGALTTNLPTAATVTPCIELEKTNGGTSRSFLVDYYFFHKRLSR